MDARAVKAVADSTSELGEKYTITLATQSGSTTGQTFKLSDWY